GSEPGAAGARAGGVGGAGSSGGGWSERAGTGGVGATGSSSGCGPSRPAIIVGLGCPDGGPLNGPRGPGSPGRGERLPPGTIVAPCTIVPSPRVKPGAAPGPIVSDPGAGSRLRPSR